MAVIVAYAGLLRAPFIYGDIPAIVGNPLLRGSLWSAFWTVPEDGSAVMGRPFLDFSFALNFRLGGLNASTYHAVNIGLQVGSSLLLFGIVRRTAQADRLFAWACALLWAVHPLLTESVSYTAQRGESLMGFLSLLSLYTLIRGAQSQAEGQPSRSGLPWFCLSAAACLLGMGAHEDMVSMPFILMLYDRTFLSDSWRQVVRWRWKWHVLYLASLAWLGWLTQVSHNRGGTYGFGIVPWLKYAGAQYPAFAHYLKLTVWPHPLVLDYGNQYISSLWQILPGGLLFTAFTVAALTTFYRPTLTSFLSIALLEFLEPTSIVPHLYQTTGEDRMYLALAALIIGGLWLWRSLLAWNDHRSAAFPAALRGDVGLKLRGRVLFTASIVLAAFALGLVTKARNAMYVRAPHLLSASIPPHA